MKNQQTFAGLEYSSRKRTTRREEILDTHLRMPAVSANFYMASRSTLCELSIYTEG